MSASPARAAPPVVTDQAEPAPASTEEAPEDAEPDSDAGEADDEVDGEAKVLDQGGGIGGSVLSADDPDAKRAQAELEGTSLTDVPEGVPDRMAPLQTAAWWTMFGTFVLGTTGALFAGLAGVEEANAERLTLIIDQTGSAAQYSTIQDEYETALRKGETYAWTSRGFLIGSGVALVAAITLFGLHARNKRRAAAVARRMQLRGPGLEVRF
ncbi:MAG: hypothetical protein R3A51_14390 [Nannocystaceae bacterium]|nr:hypothetical protein [Myxococcales bacterium]